MRFKFTKYLNIKQKVILSFTILILATASIGGVSYKYLREIELKQHLVEVADDLSNVILEIRRYEKNYLLYHLDEDLQENRKYILQGLDILDKALPVVKELNGAPLLNRVRRELVLYQRLMEPSAPDTRPRSLFAQDQLREHGKTLVDVSRRLVAFERSRILNIVESLKTQLLIALWVLIFPGGVLVFLAARKIILPLRVIEKTTYRIAQGDFRPIPLSEGRDETQRVIEGFNRMISELEKRQDQLLQAKKLSSLGTLTSGIAHQLNNPLNNISTSCQILLEEFGQADKEFCLRMLTNVEGEVHRARDIVRGLLEFSRVKEFSLAPVPLSRVVDRSLGLISSQIPPGVEVVRNIPDDLTLHLDAQRMQQVFLNLLENSVHAIEPPGEIAISARSETSEGRAVVVFEDTGRGINDQDIGRIFDPFFTTKDVGSGTGLGLSIVFGIIQKHRGTIAVESKEGQGTRFTIRLPLDRAC